MSEARPSGEEVRVCAVGDVAPGTARRVTIGKRAIAVVHLDDDWYAVGDICTHQKISLSEGELHPETKEIECWKHGSRFSLIDGRPHSLPATRPIPVYDIRVEGEDVIVVVGS
jgi:3-phenylpropionate/trans-cinnamate dioxygenase ferredoxin subunit